MKELLKAEAIANRIRMARLAGHIGSFLMVEGDDDAKFFAEFVDKQCHIQIGYGKPKVQTALAVLGAENFAGVLAVVDADFEMLDGKSPGSPNLVWTDLHDLEMILIRSPALDRVLRHYGDPALLERQDVRTRLLSMAMPIGYWRWLSSRNGLALVFEGLDFESFVHEKTLRLHEDKLLRAIEVRTKKPAYHLDTHLPEIELLRQLNPDPWHLCCGHDVVELLAIGLKRVFSKPAGNSTNKSKPAELRGPQLEMSLCLAFHHADFVSTELAARILEWKARTGFVVLAKAA